MNENYKRMMNQVKLSPEKRNEIAEKLSAEPQKNERKTLRFPVKAILVAAAVCVMLIGTVIAAEYFEKRIELGEQSSTTEQASYEIVPDIKPWTLDQLSEILRIDLENGTIERIFNDKAELEKYLGIELIDSTALEKAVIIDDLESSIEYGWNEREETLLDPNARYIVSTTDLDNKFTDTDPSVIKITSHRVMRNSEILIDARIITENTTIDELKAGVFGENFRPKTMLKHE